jgi:hypothetical protein
MTMPITPEQIATLRQLDAGRTRGVLTFESRDGYDNDGCECMHDIVSIDGKEYLDVLDTSDEGCVPFLVAAANTLIPALDEIERLRQAVASVIDAVEMTKRPCPFELVRLLPSLRAALAATDDTAAT